MIAPGLSADWLNGWLAAVGVLCLLPDVRLSWTGDATPVACFHADEDIVDRVLDALPAPDFISALPTGTSSHNVNAGDFVKLAEDARRLRDPYFPTLATDLVRDCDDKLPRGWFNPSAQQGITLAQRYNTCRSEIVDSEAVRDALLGRGLRRNANGLGFDYRRLPSAVYDNRQVYIDPVVECLCFAALPLFPIRGDGRRTKPSAAVARRTRGWLLDGKVRRFIWGSWSPALDRWSVDALLDMIHRQSNQRANLGRAGVTSLFESVEYRGGGGSDVNTGYASRRLW